MKKPLNLALPALLLAALCLPAFAQDGGTETGSATLSSDGTYESDDDKVEKTAGKPATTEKAPQKAAAQKSPAKKKKKAAPVSEYKFSAVETAPAYKFDKDSAPITKDKKKAAPKTGKKPAKKGAKKAAKKPVSEYKFDAVEKVPTYKMDKNADPIVKPAKKAKKAAPKKPAPAETGFGEEASGAIPETD